MRHSDCSNGCMPKVTQHANHLSQLFDCCRQAKKGQVAALVYCQSSATFEATMNQV